MLKEAYGIKKLVIRTGKTDLRYGIDRLCSIVRTEYGLNPREEGVLYIFCGTRNDRLKALVFEGDGFVLLTKRLLKGMEFKWPRSQTQALEIPAETYMELMNGCEVESSIPYSEGVPEHEDGADMEEGSADISPIETEFTGMALGKTEPDGNKIAGPCVPDVPVRPPQERGRLDAPEPEVRAHPVLTAVVDGVPKAAEEFWEDDKKTVRASPFGHDIKK